MPGIKGMTTFEVYAADFWDWEKSEYLKERRKRRNLTRAYADHAGKIVKGTIVPYFGKMRLDRITGEVIEKWMDDMLAEKYDHSSMKNPTASPKLDPQFSTDMIVFP